MQIQIRYECPCEDGCPECSATQGWLYEWREFEQVQLSAHTEAVRELATKGGDSPK